MAVEIFVLLLLFVMLLDLMGWKIPLQWNAIHQRPFHVRRKRISLWGYWHGTDCLFLARCWQRSGLCTIPLALLQVPVRFLSLCLHCPQTGKSGQILYPVLSLQCPVRYPPQIYAIDLPWFLHWQPPFPFQGCI